MGINTEGTVTPDWANPTLRKILASKGDLDHRPTQTRLAREGNKQAMKYADVSVPWQQVRPVLCGVFTCR